MQVQKGSLSLSVFEGMYFCKVKDKKEIFPSKLKIVVVETGQEVGMYEYAWLTCFSWQVMLFQAYYSLTMEIMYVAHWQGKLCMWNTQLFSALRICACVYIYLSTFMPYVSEQTIWYVKKKACAKANKFYFIFILRIPITEELTLKTCCILIPKGKWWNASFHLHAKWRAELMLLPFTYFSQQLMAFDIFPMKHCNASPSLYFWNEINLETSSLLSWQSTA